MSPPTAQHPPDKSCLTCGRTITWRKKWERDWEQVRYCSDGCKRHRPGATDLALEASLAELTTARKSVCPSEAARAVGGEQWRELMEPARAAARRMVARGEAEITQGGRVVDGSFAKGPIRVRRVQRG